MTTLKEKRRNQRKTANMQRPRPDPTVQAVAQLQHELLRLNARVEVLERWARAQSDEARNASMMAMNQMLAHMSQERER